jgi:hypothetical protein
MVVGVTESSSAESNTVPAPFVFVVGRGRSGTTLVRAMLEEHPRMAIPEESHFVVQLARQSARYERDGGFDVHRFAQDLFGHWAFRRWGISRDDTWRALREAHPQDVASALRAVYASYARSVGKERYGDKTPSYVMNIDLLGRTFPEAVFVHIIRDGRDVALSYLATDFGPRTVAHAAMLWDRFVRAGRDAGGRLGSDRYLEIRYEELVADPERVLHDVCGFVGLSFDERMLRYHERAAAFVPSLAQGEHHTNLYRPPTAGLRDWRREMSHRQLAVFESIAGGLLDELGYERSIRARTRAVTVAVTFARLEAHAERLRHRVDVGARLWRHRAARRARALEVRAELETVASGPPSGAEREMS